MLFFLIILNLLILYYNWESLKYNCDVIEKNIATHYMNEGYDEETAYKRAAAEIGEQPFMRTVKSVESFFNKIKEYFSKK